MSDRRTLLVCSCEDTMPLDAGAFERGCRGVDIVSGRQFCRAELERVRALMSSGEPITIGCTQEAPLFREIAAGSGSDVSFANIRDHYTPIEWAKIAVQAYKAHGADRVVAEVNNGGEMVEATLRVVDDNLAYTAVHATRGKVVRAEPVSALYEQGRIRHMGAFTALEDQMCEL